MALTFEQFKVLRAKGLSPEQIAKLESGYIPQKTEVIEEQPQGLLSKAGQFIKDVAVETTKTVAQSLLSPYQASATAFNIARAPSKEKVESETAKTTAVIKRMKELEKMGQTKTSEYSNLVSQLKQKSEAYKKSDTFIAPETISTGIWGDIEAPKTVEEVLGTGAKTLSLAASPAAGGALWAAGEAMQQNKGLGEVLGYTVAGGVLGKTAELAFRGLGTLMKVSGKALAATKVSGQVAGVLSATEKNAERVMASLIKPLKKNLSFGKRPALELAREVAKADKVPGNWDDLVSFTSKAWQKSGKEIGKFYDKADKTIKTRFNAETAINDTINAAKKEAIDNNNKALAARIEDTRKALTDILIEGVDDNGQIIIRSAGKRDLTKLKPSEVQDLIKRIGKLIKWTENRSDDLTVNRALTDTYRALRRVFESGLSKENKATGALARRLNEKYANLTSALDAVNYRRDVVNRQALVSLTDQQAAMAGGLFNAIRGGGNIGSILAGIGSGGFSKMIKSPWFATNLTKTIMKLSPAKRQSIFLKYPMLRGVVNQTLKTTGKGIEKFGSVLAGTPKVIRKVQTTPVSELSQKGSKLMPFGATIEDVSKEGFKKAGVPKSSNIFTKEDAGLAKTIRESKGLSADDIMSKYPDIKLKKDIPAKDIHGNKIEIPQGETLTPYEIKGNKVLLQDGQTYIVAKNQFQNIKGNSIVAEGKKFAPELEGLEETIKNDVIKQATFDDVKWKGNKDDLFGEFNGRQFIIKKEPDGYYVAEKDGLLGRTARNYTDAVKTLNRYLKENTPRTKYSSYTLPGGENYREILIKAPNNNIKLPEGAKVVNRGEKVGFYVEYNDKLIGNGATAEIAIQDAKDTLSNNFKSSHWDEPNVISHIRMNDRTYKGKKVAFMEELQSDWAREGRRKGFIKPEEQNLTRIQRMSSGKVGDIPYNENLKNWQQLSIKRALKDAVDNNAEYFAWTTGEQQSARYNLAIYIDNIKWGNIDYYGKKPNLVSIKAKDGNDISILVDKSGKIISGRKGKFPTGNEINEYKGKNLDEVLGKGLADKIMEKETGTLSGEGLKFGGEWANNLYDKQVKNIVEDLTGEKVEMIDLGLPVDKIKSFDLLKDGSGERIGKLTPNNIKVGKIISDSNGSYFIVTDILGGGKFKAVPNIRMGDWDIQRLMNNELEKAEIERLNEYKQIFDISQKTIQQQAIKLTPEIKAIIKGEAPRLKKSMDY